MEVYVRKMSAIEKLERSNSFPKKEIYFQLLRYMVEEEKEGRNVKSSTIAIDLLHDEGDKAMNRDSFIRSKVLSLRKYLDQFYLSEGKDFTTKIYIPKGNYKVLLREEEPIKEVKSNRLLQLLSKQTSSWWFMMTSVLLGGLCVYLLFKQSTNVKTIGHPSSFVSLLINTNAPLDIVFGDRGFYNEYDTILKRHRAIYDTDVNLPENFIRFNKLKEQFPERDLFFDRNFYHTDIDNIYLLSDLKVEWVIYEQPVRLIPSSQKKQIDRNTVFLSKTSSADMYELFSHYFLDSRVNFRQGEMKYLPFKSYTLQDTVVDFKTASIKKEGKNFTRSYCLLKKLITLEHHELLFILPSNDAARKYIHEKLFDTSFREELLQSFRNGIPDQFELLLEILGYGTQANEHQVLGVYPM